MSLSNDKQADIIAGFNSTSRYLDDILNINNIYVDNMVSQIHPSELQLNRYRSLVSGFAFDRFSPTHLMNSIKHEQTY